MPSRTTSFYLDEIAISHLNERSARGSFSRSLVLKRIVQRYAESIRRNQVSFSEGDLSLLESVVARRRYDHPGSINRLEMDVEDDYGSEASDLIKRLRKMSYEVKLAIIDRIEISISTKMRAQLDRMERSESREHAGD